MRKTADKKLIWGLIVALVLAVTPVTMAQTAYADQDGPVLVAALKIFGKKKTAAPAAEEEAPAPAVEEAAPTPVIEEEAPAPADIEEAAAPEATEEDIEEAAMDDEELADVDNDEYNLLTIESAPSGVKVFIDGEELGVTPLEVEGLSSLPHEVILYHDELGAISRKVDSGAGDVFVDFAAEGKTGAGAGFVLLETDPPNVRIDIDGKNVGLSPMRVPLPAGRHTVVLSRTGYQELEFEVVIEADAAIDLKKELAEKPGSLLIITSPSGAEIFLDGQSLGVTDTPIRVTGVAPGLHTIIAKLDGYDTWERTNVLVQREKIETVLASLKLTHSETNVRIYSQPEGARVWLDGKEMGVAGPDGVGFTSTKGLHILRMELNPALSPGYRPLQVSMNFDKSNMNFKETPIKLPVIDESFINAQRLFERGENEQAMSYLDRVSSTQSSYSNSRMMMVEILQSLSRYSEIPAEFEKLFDKPMYRKNPVLNLGMGFWCIKASQKANEAEARDFLAKGIDALDRASETIDYFPANERRLLALKAHYYTAIAAETLFNLTGEKKHVKKGVQAWELFFSRLDDGAETLGDEWIDKARNHQKNLQYLEKKLGG